MTIGWRKWVFCSLIKSWIRGILQTVILFGMVENLVFLDLNLWMVGWDLTVKKKIWSSLACDNGYLLNEAKKLMSYGRLLCWGRIETCQLTVVSLIFLFYISNKSDGKFLLWYFSWIGLFNLHLGRFVGLELDQSSYLGASAPSKSWT